MQTLWGLNDITCQGISMGRQMGRLTGERQ